MEILFFAVLCALAGATAWIGFELRAIRKIHQARWDYDRLNKTVEHIWERLSPGQTIDKNDYCNTILGILSQPKPIVRMRGKSTQSDKPDACLNDRHCDPPSHR